MLILRVNFYNTFLVILTWICIVSIDLSTAFPTTKNKYFPEQDLPSPINLRDGQPIRVKLFIMKMLNIMERQTSRSEGVTHRIPWIREYVYEGDIILQKGQAVDLVNRNKRRKKRKLDAKVTSSSSVKKWPLPINYIFDGKHTLLQQHDIRLGIQHWEDETCITFTNYTNTTDKSIKFINDSACYSYVGNKQGIKEQVISIGKTCTRKGIVAHEIGHALGFWHEHARADRDDHLTVIKANVTIGQHHNFDKYSWQVINNLAVPYDLGSVMHYSGMQFSKGTEITMRTHNRLLQNTIGQREALSFFDVKLANKAYCNDVCQPDRLKGDCLHDGYQDPKNCSRCRCPNGLSGDFCQQVAPSSHNCGGNIELNATSIHTVTSPDHTDYYQGHVHCYWLIQSPTGTAINIQFMKPFMRSQFCDELRPYLPCEDFVEIRFTDSLGITGGRFCCDDAVQSQTLSDPIVAHSNHALILFDTYAPGHFGFQAEISIESCGGCHNNVTDNQLTCIRKRRKECYQTWYKAVKLNTCAYAFWGCRTEYQTQAVRRKTTCYTEEPYCCNGYILSLDFLTCTKDPEAVSDHETNATASNEQTDVSNSTTVEDDQGSLGASAEWTDWDQCSEFCGGCGTQSRSLLCRDGDTCLGESEETRKCGITRCDYGNLQQHCARTFVKSQPCPSQSFFWIGDSSRLCNVTVTEYYSQTKNCCCGYYVQNGICEPNTEK